MTFLLLALGICLGSFVNALVWRLKTNRNWVSERSECVHCHHKLAANDLIPVVSWMLLKGKCRYCHKRISAQYPIVELCVGLLFALSYTFWPYEFDNYGIMRLAFWLTALVLLAALFLYDLKWMKFPTVLLNSLIIVSVLQLVFIVAMDDDPWHSLLVSLLSMIIGGGLFFLIYVMTKGKGIGDGDIYLGVGFGLLLANPMLTWIAITVASLIGSVVALYLIAKGSSTKAKLPFGPFLISGVVISGIFGSSLWAAVSTIYLF